MNLIKTCTLLTFLTGILIMGSPQTAHAQARGNGGDFGLGVILGEPTGVSVKVWNNDRSAFDIGAAWSFAGSHDAIHLHGDYLLHSWLNGVEDGDLAFYYGIGARVILSDPDARLGVRIPLGLNYIVPNSRIDIFAEIAPILDLTPNTDFNGNGGVGIRYYF